MYHYVNAITNTKGDALIGYYVQLTDSVTGDVVPIYADNNSTPIISVSGVENKAKVDSDGNASFYVPSGTYDINQYATNATTKVQTIPDIPMIDLAAVASAAIDRADLSRRTAVDGDNVQLTENGVEGWFVFDDSDLSAEVTADPDQFNYIAPDSDSTGANGAWVRNFDNIGLALDGTSLALSDTVTITPDFAAARNFHVTLGGNRALAAPANVRVGQQGRIRITQDATGNRNMTAHGDYKFPSGTLTLSTAPDAVDIIDYYVFDEHTIECTLRTAVAGSAPEPGSQTIGETEAFTSGSASSDHTFLINEPVAKAGQLVSISGKFNGSGTIKVRAATLSGTTVTFYGPTITLTISGSGTQTWTAPDDFTALDVAENDRIGVYAGTKLHVISGDQPFNYISGDAIATSTGQSSTVGTPGDIQIALDVTLSERNGARVALIGDSTIAEYPVGVVTPMAELIAGIEAWDISHAGDTVLDQNNLWDSTIQPDGAFEAVVIQVGLNNIIQTASTASTITALQALVDEIRSDVRSDCKIVISQMIPCAARWYSFFGATDGATAYQKWLDINAAIAGSGGSPITGVDARVTAHVALMAESRDLPDDGSGSPAPNCLKTAYDTGDGIHPNDAGRAVNAEAIYDALVGLGLI